MKKSNRTGKRRTYPYIVKQLKKFKHILVTGPQRAGTTIAMTMIARDLGYAEYRQPAIDILEFIQAQGGGPMVIQCPANCAEVHKYAKIEGLAVVIMVRNVRHIMASQDRIRWGFEDVELTKYDRQGLPIAQVKYDYWRNHQRAILGKQGFELAYESLKKHPLWVPKKQRRDFWTGQVKLNKPLGERYQLKDENYYYSSRIERRKEYPDVLPGLWF